MAEFTHQAAPLQKQQLPAFIVKKVDEKRKLLRRFIGEDRTIQSKEISVDGGFIVAFPMKGHSIRVADEKELKRLGFDKMIPIMDASQEDADEPVSYLPNSVSASTKGN